MSRTAAAAKPQLQGVNIKTRKRTAKAQAKHEPEGGFRLLSRLRISDFTPEVFRDQLYKHIETVPKEDFEGYTNKLVQAGVTLEYLKVRIAKPSPSYINADVNP